MDKAADLSGSPRFGELIRQAAPHFDWIIVDSSPVLPVSDAVNLARFCDGVLLVARGGVTKFPIAQRAQSELKASNILGFVLNAVEDSPQVGNYYGYDGPGPPWNDELVHHYVFTLYALDVPRLGVQGTFGGAEARAAITGHVLAQAALTGKYTLNPSVRI